MLHQTLLVTLVLALCVLSGCISSYDPHVTERPMPTELHADAQSESEVEPVDVTVPGAVDAENARAVALAEVVKVAMAEPTSVLEAAARLEAASGRVATSDGRLLPGLSADFRVRYLDGREIGSFGLLQADVNFARYEPTAAFFYRNNPGAAGTGSKAARRFADAAGYDLKEAQRQAMLQAALSYQDIALTRASMAIATQLVQDARRFYDIANARAVAEIASGADVARAEAALAQAQRAEIQARAFWKAASIRLAQLLRWDLSELLTTGDEEIGLEPVVDDASEANLTGEAQRARPDVQAAKKRAEGGTIRTKQQWWDLPRLTPASVDDFSAPKLRTSDPRSSATRSSASHSISKRADAFAPPGGTPKPSSSGPKPHPSRPVPTSRPRWSTSKPHAKRFRRPEPKSTPPNEVTRSSWPALMQAPGPASRSSNPKTCKPEQNSPSSNRS